MFCPVSLMAEAEPEPYRYIIKRECFACKDCGQNIFSIYICAVKERIRRWVLIFMGRT